MRNPIRSEADAFRFVLLTIGYFALIVIGSVINVWLGVAVFAALTAGVLWLFLMRRGERPAPVRQAPAARLARGLTQDHAANNCITASAMRSSRRS